MDVREERKKMVRLVVEFLTGVDTRESDLCRVSPGETFVLCKCGRGLVLRFLGGKYQGSYVGRCTCGKGWFLADLPAKLPF